MPVYLDHSRKTSVTAVEVNAVAGDVFCAFHFSTHVTLEQAVASLQEIGVDAEFMGGTLLQEHPVVMVKARQEEALLVKSLNNSGMKLALLQEEQKKAFNPWKLRGQMSMAGQGLQLVSSYFSAKGIDMPTMTFASSNILANLSNMIFGSQKTKDTHQLRYLKQMVNNQLAEQYQAADLPDINEKRASLRPHPAKTAGQKLYDTLKGYSVSVGEVGLRMFGAFNLAFPFMGKSAGNWKTASTHFGNGEFKSGFNSIFNSDRTSGYVGLAYVIGKTIALFSRIPDPYNPRPQTSLDKIREKVLFRLSSVIEAGAAGVLAYDRIAKRKLNADKLNKIFGTSFDAEKPPADYFGALGGGLFTLGLGIRYFAPFGERQVDMHELKAHVSDALAKVPQEQLPQAITETTAALVTHFGEKKISFGQLYAELAEDLLTQHNRSVPSLLSMTEQQRLEAQLQQPEKTFAAAGLKKSGHHNVKQAPAQFSEKLISSEGDVRQSLFV